jgi:hypothetical protein
MGRISGLTNTDTHRLQANDCRLTECNFSISAVLAGAGSAPRRANADAMFWIAARFQVLIWVACTPGQRWSWIFDQFAAGLSYSMGFMSGGGFQVRGPAIISLVRRQQPMG